MAVLFRAHGEFDGVEAILVRPERGRNRAASQIQRRHALRSLRAPPRDGLTGAMHDITEMEIARNDAAVTALERIIRRLRAKIDEVGDED